MLYGIIEEPAARIKYTDFTGIPVQETGLWINKKHPHLVASPDGIVS